MISRSKETDLGLVAVAVVAALVLPFLGKAVHVDDANFLRLAEGAARDPWRPHAIPINWLGTTEPAFDVLSNPPGIGWWLLPVRNASEWVMHLWMLPWLALALFGMYRLARAFGVSGGAALLVLGTSPVFVLCSQSLCPDLPLFACIVAGIAGFLAGGNRAWAWALLAGCSTLFRYSGICVIPLLLFAGFKRRSLPHALASIVPFAALVLHDLHAYGRVHFLAMVDFQGTFEPGNDYFHKAVAFIAMLGGAGLLPVLPWRNPASWLWMVGGAGLGLSAAIVSEQSLAPALATVLSCAAGGIALGVLRLETKDDDILVMWGLLGVVFLLGLSFAATRYWLPFLPPFALAALRRGSGLRRVVAAAAIGFLVSFGMSVDDAAMAEAYKRAAAEVASSGTRLFVGHWGWQHYMEKHGARALEEGELPTGAFAVAWAPWPQEPAEDACVQIANRIVLDDHWPGPRVHSAAAGVNFHTYMVTDEYVTDTYAPWSFSSEPYDRIEVYEPCP